MEINCQWGSASLAKHVVIADKYENKTRTRGTKSAFFRYK